MLKILAVLCLPLLFLSCKNRDVAVLNVVAKEWRGGIKDNYGISYTVTLIAGQPSDKINIDKMWIGNDGYEVKAAKRFPYIPEDGFIKNDTIYIFVHQNFTYDNNGNKVFPQQTLMPLPFEYKGKILIGYLKRNKRKYIAIDTIKIEKPMLMP